MKKTNTVEILYIAGSSRDRRGPRAMVGDDSGTDLWIGFHGNMGRIGHMVRTGSCQKRPYTAFLCHRDNRTVPGFAASALH